MPNFAFADVLRQDARFATRMLRKTPVFTIAAVLTLALGIGANTAIFSLFDAVMLRNLPVKDPQKLILLSWVSAKWPKVAHIISGGAIGQDQYGRTVARSFSYPLFERFASRENIFSTLFGVHYLGPVSISIRGHAILAEGEIVTGQFFSGLGVQPILGRAITIEDEKPAAEAVVVISYNFWQGHFSADSSAVGQSIVIKNTPFVVIGVAPSEFFGIEPGFPRDFWVPVGHMASLTGTTSFTRRDNWWISIMGRLRPGITEEQARSALDVLFTDEATFEIKPAPEEIPKILLSSGKKGLDSLRAQFSDALQLLFIAVAIVLLVACVNLSGLLLSRAAGRCHEISVRLAVGADRARLIRQLLTESLLLALLGGTVALFVALWSSHVLLRMVSPARHPIPILVGLDWPTLAFTLGVSVATAVLFGLAPALRITHLDINTGLRENPSSIVTVLWTRLRLREVLLVAQIAISVLLLVGAGLLVRTLGNLQDRNLGFSPQRILLFHVDPTQQGYGTTRLANFYEDLLRGFGRLSGIDSVSLSSQALLSEEAAIFDGFEVEGTTSGSHGKIAVYKNWISDHFLETMGIPLLAGRKFGPEDTATSPKVALINRTMARQFFGDENPVGRRLFNVDDHSKMTIVGVIRDTIYNRLDQEPPPTLYVPYLQGGIGGATFEVRAVQQPGSLVAGIRNVVARADSKVPLSDLRTQEEQIYESLSQQRLFARLSTFFGSLTLLLVFVGIYAHMNHAVTQRMHEIGVRMALGAEPFHVLRMILGESSRLLVYGAAVGVGAAIVTTRLLNSFLFGLKPNDPSTIVASVVLIVATSVLATYFPARRAMRVDPMAALHYE